MLHDTNETFVLKSYAHNFRRSSDISQPSIAWWVEEVLEGEVGSTGAMVVIVKRVGTADNNDIDFVG